MREGFDQMERALHEIQGTLEVQFKRIAALQAEVDHLAAKLAARFELV